MKPTQHSISAIAIAACGIFVGLPCGTNCALLMPSPRRIASFLDPR